jgi:hypothetical protein
MVCVGENHMKNGCGGFGETVVSRCICVSIKERRKKKFADLECLYIDD